MVAAAAHVETLNLKETMMLDRLLWKLVLASVVVVWVALAVFARDALGAFKPNPTAQVQKVARQALKLTPFQTGEQTTPDGRVFVCQAADDAPSAKSMKFTVRVVVCVLKKTGAKS